MAARALALAVGLLAAAGSAGAQKFRPDDPLRVDADDLPVAKPAVVELSTTYDVLENTFAHRAHGAAAPAANVNTLGEVPDSSWFRNRLGVREMSIAELVRGPDETEGPAPGPWTVIAAKSGGITPGFRIRDARGEVFFVKFDPREYPNLSTAAEVIGTKFFHATGYHVPENHIAYFRRAQVTIAPGTRVTRHGGKTEPMTEADLDLILGRVPVRPDGTIRCVAGRRLPGEDVGPHEYHGTRGDDANDIFPHEDRRELRGLRVFAAWLNHDDSRSINSDDRFLRGSDDRGHVRHYLLDFSSTLGSGSDALRRIAPQNPRAGNEYVLEVGPAAKAAITLGLWERPWRRVKYAVHPEIGRIEADFFRPERWKPEYPNPAFQRMQPADAFWAARIVSRFTDTMVRAIVHTGQFTDTAAEARLADTVIRRRDKVLAYYFRAQNPLAEFAVSAGEGPVLEFRNLGEEAGLGSVQAYEYRWFAFDNRTGDLRPLGEARSTAARRLPIPSPGDEFVMVRIRTRGTEPGWTKNVDVYLRGRTAPPALVGIEREG
jgi:hypothetical protein